ncbi:MAG: InlB B-repeat-containing protein [Clostridia bacterium]|nr:InlB B-repeat-containing protein [Clostridia bacterium]
MAEKKKKSFLSIFFKIILSLVVFVVLAVVGLGIFVKVKYDVNPLALIGQIKSLNQPVNTSQVVDNAYAEADLESANSKLDGITSSTAYVILSDKELAAYVNDKLQNQEGGVKVNFGSSQVNLVDYGFALLQYKFSDIPSAPENHFADINFVVKINLNKFKDQKMSAFPASMFKGIVPNELYFSVSASIDKSEEEGAGAYDYQLGDIGLTVNNLDSAETENVFKLLNMFSGIGSASDFAKTLADSFVGALLGDNGVYGALKDNTDRPAQGYSFEHTESSNNFVVYFVDTTETRTLSFVSAHGTTLPLEFNITYNTITLPTPVADGYSFDGWYADVDGTQTKFTTIDVRENFEDKTFTARWSLVNYTISYDLNGGEVSETLKTTYTIEDADFVLPTPTKQVGDQPFIFKGWAGTTTDGVENPVTIETGTFGNLTFTAYYVGETRAVSLVVDGKTYNTEALSAVDVGSTLSEDTFFDASEVGLGGFMVDTWYKDSALTQEFDFSTKIFENTTLYGSSWKYLINDILFEPYKSTFDNARSSGEVTVSSREMLVAFIDYVVFNNVKEEIRIYFNTSYVANNQSAQETEFSEAFTQYSNLNDRLSVGFQYVSGCNRTIMGTWYRLFYIDESDIDVAKVDFATTKEITATVYEQQDYAYKVSSSGREEDFDNFNVNNITKTLAGLTSSEQVFWALQSGFKPVCKSGSAAETVYNKAKEVLREICDDSMDDVTKLKAIYEWLILNVQYDYDAAAWLEDTTISAVERAERNSEAHKYACWSAEGALLNGKAVCEGFAKSLLIMARIEGIPTIYVTGNGHAWNKVYLNGKWFGIDATHGNPGNESRKMETVSYAEFLFTDEQKANKGFTSVNHTECEANTEYNEYERDYEYLGHSFDLVIDSAQEFAYVLRYIASYETEVGTYFTVNVLILYSHRASFDSWLNYALAQSGLSRHGEFYIQDGRNGVVNNSNTNHNNLTYSILLQAA